jgi:NADPH-dependent 2,4-dienoyl-CoA reductase/sulfur reductase-like enzyme/rhodanese-related sulfurtransferase
MSKTHKLKLLIVGGVAGGASAAARSRRLSEDAEIIIFERGPDVSFANCGLPYYIGGKIAERDKLLVTTASRLRSRFNLDVRTLSSVEAIDRTTKTVRIHEVSSGREYSESYDKLILATGAAPFCPSIPGSDLPGVFTLRNLQDTDQIKDCVNRGIKHAVLLGGGFISLELAENFVRAGIATTIVEKNSQLLAPFDPEMTTPIVQKLKDNGISLLLGQSAEAIKKSAFGLEVCLSSGQTLSAELVIFGIGVRPENKLATDAGLEVGLRGGIKVNQFLQTTDPDIYAVGDAIEVMDVVSGTQTQVPLAGPANRQGRIAADNVFGRSVRYRGTQGTAILGLFDLTAAITGSSEKVLERANRSFRKIYIHPSNHAGYYPGAEAMTIKLLFCSESGLVLGAQGVGGQGVDKRIDVIAVAIQAKMTVFDLEEMELCYSPQYGSAKDPVNMAGFVASGLLRGEHPQIDVNAVLGSTIKEQPFLLDVRTLEEYTSGHIPGAINLPVDNLRSHLNELPRDRTIAVYCQVGQRGYLATRILLQNGFSAVNIGGGYKTYKLFQTAS